MDILLICALPLGYAFLFGCCRELPARGLNGLWIGSLLTTLGSVAWLLSYLPALLDQQVIAPTVPWVPTIGLSLSFYLDGLSLLFGLLITGIGTAVFFYTRHYLEDDREFQRFYAWLQAFTSAMLFLVMAGNVITLFMAWELTSITSFMLIGFEGARKVEARQGALTAFVVTGMGGLALLVGLVLLAFAVSPQDFNGFELATIVAHGNVQDHPWYGAMVGLLLLAAFTKSAQVPFHFWLPGSMTAPSPASAFLHSATMVKAGVYLIARLSPTLGDTLLWTTTLTTVGFTTLVLGAYMAVQQRDLKAILAYTTVSYLGLIVGLLGLPDGMGLKAAMIVLLAHALYKAPLFLMAGVVEHATHTRQLDHLGGLAHKMPIAAGIVGLAALSMMGMWPWLGFVAKEVAIVGLMDFPILLFVLLASALLTTVAALLVSWRVFMGPLPTNSHDIHVPHWPLLVGPGVLVILGLVLGGLANTLALPVMTTSVTAIGGEPVRYLLAANFYASWAFLWSGLALGGGLTAFIWRERFAQLGVNFTPSIPSGMACYQACVRAVEAFADLLLRAQGGRIRDYLSVILGVFVLMMLATGGVGASIEPFVLTLRSSADVLGVLLVILTIGGAVASILVNNHLTAALALGVTGYAVGGLILLEPGPDVALVQFLVETLGTVLMVLMMARINTDYRHQATQQNWQQSLGGVMMSAVLAIATGILVTLFALAAVTSRDERMDRTIAHWHLENAYPQTGVTDVVAAILADFRATDTLLEIAVFAMAALGVVTLLSLTLPSNERESAENNPLGVPSDDPTGALPVISHATAEPQTATAPMTELAPAEGAFPKLTHEGSSLSNPFTRGVAVLVLPFSLLIAITHVLYGGNGPGDGFAAGVIAGLAVSLWYIVFGYQAARERLRWLRAGTWLTAGLVLASVNALLPLLFDRAFFAITKITSIPAPAGLHFASTLIFEMAIFMTVFGGVSLIMESIAHPETLQGERLAADDTENSSKTAAFFQRLHAFRNPKPAPQNGSENT